MTLLDYTATTDFVQRLCNEKKCWENRHKNTKISCFQRGWCPRPDLNWYAPITEAADFKSDVSTNFTTRAQTGLTGGATQSRTGLHGFAIRCITDLLSRHRSDKKGKPQLPFSEFGAGKESRTLDLNLGKVALYQLSYSRVTSRKL